MGGEPLGPRLPPQETVRGGRSTHAAAHVHPEASCVHFRCQCLACCTVAAGVPPRRNANMHATSHATVRLHRQFVPLCACRRRREPPGPAPPETDIQCADSTRPHRHSGAADALQPVRPIPLSRWRLRSPTGAAWPWRVMHWHTPSACRPAGPTMHSRGVIALPLRSTGTGIARGT